MGAGCGKVGLGGNSGILRATQLEKRKKNIKSTFCFSICIALNHFQIDKLSREYLEKKFDWTSKWSLTSDDIKALGSADFHEDWSRVGYLGAGNRNAHTSSYSDSLKFFLGKVTKYSGSTQIRSLRGNFCEQHISAFRIRNTAHRFCICECWRVVEGPFPSAQKRPHCSEHCWCLGLRGRSLVRVNRSLWNPISVTVRVYCSNQIQLEVGF